VTARRGGRWSTYSAFLKPVDGRSNLKIATHSLVEKILIDDSNRAYAVQYRRHGRIHIVRARKEIVLCAGTVGSPQILMLSGIGPKDHLEDLGVRRLKS
jgi:choline dehydrogenase